MPSALAQSISETIVVTATVSPAALETLGQSVTLLTRDDLERLGVSSVTDAIRLAPGVDVEVRGPRGEQTDFSIRGATFGQTLVLVDGQRLNDSQTGHHNGDIPMTMSGVERIEVVSGAGSTVHGADALGGTINVITRRDAHADGEVAVGQYGYVSAQGSMGGVWLPPSWVATGWASRSSGFQFDREFTMGGAAVRGEVAPGWTIDVRHQRKAFGANNFYGASPSYEWTDQTLTSTTWNQTRGRWTTELRALWRNHGDHFRWDINQPGFAENRHRDNNADVTLTVGRDLGDGRRVTVGADAGADWVRSNNLGDHDYSHQSGFAELQLPLASRVTARAGLRLDRYTTFGTATSPSASLSVGVGPSLKLRASVGRAFRIPTFTELYYHDPASLGSPDLRPEYGWSVDAGADWVAGGWTISGSPFSRWDHDVIDWIRPRPGELWRSTNVRDVHTSGGELAASRHWRLAVVRAYFAAQSVEAPAIASLSKYVLAYARRSAGLSVAAPLAPGWQGALNLDRRERLDGQRYWLLGARLSRAFGRTSLFLDGTNLLDETYTEIGVALPGRWISAGVSVH